MVQAPRSKRKIGPEPMMVVPARRVVKEKTVYLIWAKKRVSCRARVIFLFFLRPKKQPGEEGDKAQPRSSATSLWRPGELLRRNDHDAGVALEILRIEGENGSDFMHVHRGNESSVVGVLAADLMLSHDLFPLAIDVRNLLEQHEK